MHQALRSLAKTNKPWGYLIRFQNNWIHAVPYVIFPFLARVEFLTCVLILGRNGALSFETLSAALPWNCSIGGFYTFGVSF
jgi:hypothetical protein